MSSEQNQRLDRAGAALWRFSLALYARPGVAAALLALQDRGGHDVNLILFALWLGAVRGRRLDAADLAAARAAIAPLATGAVAPLRDLRRRLKASMESDLQALRRRILGLEIAAERLVQQRLASCAEDGPEARPPAEQRGAAVANLALCLGDDALSSEAELLRQAVAALARAAPA